MQHDCAGTHKGGCTFSSDLTQLARADAVLFSAQLFPGLGRFEEVMRAVARSPSTSSILWNTEAVDSFRLGPQLPVLSIYRSIYLFIDLSVYLSICLSIYLSLYLSIYLSIYLYTYT
jgi:hypothetical protein